VSLVVAALDTNRDGQIDAQEIAGATAALKSLDKNSDGKLAADELRPPPAPVVVPASDIVERLMEFDRNRDGKLSPTEIPARMKSLLKQADTNKDGILSRSELITFTEKQEAVRRQESDNREKEEAERRKREGTTTPQQGPGGPGRVIPIVAALDTDKDGEISAEEIASAAVSLKILDKDSDGKIPAEELRPAPMTGPGFGAR
jgi:Ca2+-binding EF-hand superfamily protein